MAKLGAPFFNLALALLVVLSLSVAAQARVIGIVHDDSGSMENRGTLQLPAFGPQLIISTLDGQTNPATADRLFYSRLNDGSVTSAPITSQSSQQSQIERVRRLFPQGRGGTPLRMVERTLTEIIQQGRPDEEVFLVIVTDGEFNANDDATFIRDYRSLLTAIQRASQTAKGPVRTEFVLINASNDSTLVDRVQNQGIYRQLNATFNGDAEDGFYNVTSFDEMFAAIEQITARISGTEDLGQGDQIKISGTTMTLESPFSISRIVSVSSAEGGQALPNIVSTSFGRDPTYTYTTKMDRPDLAPGWDRIVNGVSQHFTFQPALEPGEHTITFDQRLSSNSFLLFESEAVVELQVFDRNGVQLTPNANGVIEVSLGEDYNLQSLVYSQESAGSPVAFSELDAAASFKTDVISGSGAKTSVPMPRNDPANRAEGQVTFGQLGDYGLRAVLRWPGFVSPTSNVTRVQVVDRQAFLAINVDPVERGASGGITVDVAPPGAPSPLVVGQVTVTDQAGIAQGVVLELTGSPQWLTIARAGGQPLGRGDVVAIGEPLELIADGSQITSGVMTSPGPFQIVAEAATPARGTVSLNVPIDVRLAEARVDPTGHSKDPSGDTPLEMNGTELQQNKDQDFGGIDALDFEIRDTLETPEIGENVEILGDPPFGLRLRAELTGNTVSVFPETSWWCPCFLYFTARPTTVSVRFDDGSGLQSATSEAQILDVNITGREALVSCMLILAVILAALYLLKALVNGLNTERFPRRSIAEIDDGGELTRKPPLRGTNLTFFKVLFWPIFGVPHERTSVDGLALQARRGGATLLLKESSLTFESDTYDDLREFREENPKKEEIPIGWFEEFKSTSGSDKVVRLLRDIGESR